MLKMPLAARGYNEKLIQMVCQAYVQSDTQIAELFVLIIKFQWVLCSSQRSLFHIHRSDIPNHRRHFLSLSSYSHINPHTWGWVPCIPKIDKQHHLWAVFQHQPEHSKRDQKVCRSLRKKAYERLVCLHFDTSPQKTYNCSLYWLTFEDHQVDPIFPNPEDGLQDSEDHPFGGEPGKEWQFPV